jgi:3-isopropylmalate/(R)-2-methylmalate dehydratase small subunit
MGAPGRMMKRPLPELAAACLESIDPTFAVNVRPGDIIVAGRAFGIGSSREQAAEALKHLGIAAVLAKSFARIFFRNAINLGLPTLIFPYADEISPGDLLDVDARQGQVTNQSSGKHYTVTCLPPRLLQMIEDGGLTPHLKRRFTREVS